MANMMSPHNIAASCCRYHKPSQINYIYDTKEDVRFKLLFWEEINLEAMLQELIKQFPPPT
jgi:hypothetical protein